MIINNKETYKPGFCCLCDGIDSEIQLNSTAAINNTYNQILNNKTKYSEIVVLSFDDEIIIHELVEDILFFSIFIHLDHFLIVVSQIGISSCECYYDAIPGYLSTFMTKFRGKQSLFVQSIKDKCYLDIYDKDFINKYHNEEITSNEIWKTIQILKKYDGAELFGITNSYVQKELCKLKKNSIMCMSNQ
ncbi:8903_t:CDS:1 [Funneliformis geosporum]|uniref:8903_t:CDS:1 n=1 Tax=Funneliformis geosporum TaxID=1117311 RepID=A0A9W4SPD2_9GLOM|nr:8903_t:CDS:1 [Funneliformis geosporum]